MDNSSEQPGKRWTSIKGLVAFLSDLVPETRIHIAWAVAECFQSVPWTLGDRPKAEPDLASLGMTAMDAQIGLEAVRWCCSNYQLVDALHDLLSELETAPPQEDRLALRRNSGRLIADGLADDFGSLREPLQILLDEDLEIEILNDLMANTELGERFRLVTAIDAHGIKYQVPEPVHGTQVPGTAAGKLSLLRPMGLWDLPAYFLERVPQTAYYFARQFGDAIRHAALTLELRSTDMALRGRAPDLGEAIAGQKLAELAAPGSLVYRFLAPVISQAAPGSEEYADLIRRSCDFLDAAVTADDEAGGQLARELAQRLSDTFVKSAAEVSDKSLTALWRVLDERRSRDADDPA